MMNLVYMRHRDLNSSLERRLRIDKICEVRVWNLDVRRTSVWDKREQFVPLVVSVV